MLSLLAKLRRIGLLSARALLGVPAALLANGPNLMALLRLRAWLHPDRLALADERERLSYLELWGHAEALAGGLYAGHGLRAGWRVAIACRNHAAAVKAIFACARLGCHVVLVSPELSADQLAALAGRMRFDFYVYDPELAPVFARPELREKALPADRLRERMVGGDAQHHRQQIIAPAGSIVVLTGGTTGAPRAAGRRPALLSFLPPFLALLGQADLDRYRRLYVATPIYHGYGLAMLLLGIALGAECYLLRRFDAARACELVAERQIEAAALVPLMLQRMLRQDAAALAPLRCAICGSAPLSPDLARRAVERLGPILFNLYGSSEAGFAAMATPELLARKPDTIGRPLPGVRAQIVDAAGKPVRGSAVGRLRIRSAWSASRGSWVDTGDLARRDADGDLFLAGRADDMIVSGGENVYPADLEHILAQHPDVEAVAVIGVVDAEFGQRLKAFVVPRPGADLDQEALLTWLRPRAARYQMPAAIELRAELPYTAIGKPDKKALRVADS